MAIRKLSALILSLIFLFGTIQVIAESPLASVYAQQQDDIDATEYDLDIDQDCGTFGDKCCKNGNDKYCTERGIEGYYVDKNGTFFKKASEVRVLTTRYECYCLPPDIVSEDDEPCGLSGSICCRNGKERYCTEPGTDGYYVDKNRNVVAKASEVRVLTTRNECYCLEPDLKTDKLSDINFDPEKICGTRSPASDCVICLKSEGIYTAIGCIPYDMSLLVNTLFSLIVSVAGIIGLLCIILSAIRIQISGAKSDANSASAARQKIIHCILGLVILIFSVFIVTIIGSGTLGFTLNPLSVGRMADQVIPTLTPTPTPIRPAPNPTANPAPPSNPANNGQVANGLQFYEDLRSVCTSIHKNNYKQCLEDMKTSVPHANFAKSILRTEMEKSGNTFLECMGMAKTIYAAMTGEKFITDYNLPNKESPRCPMYLKEPFWDFEYYKVGETTPQPGDLVKWTNGVCGHVAIVAEVVSANKFDVVESNFGCQGCIQKRRGVSISEPGLKGFYRHK